MKYMKNRGREGGKKQRTKLNQVSFTLLNKTQKNLLLYFFLSFFRAVAAKDENNQPIEEV